MPKVTQRVGGPASMWTRSPELMATTFLSWAASGHATKPTVAMSLPNVLLPPHPLSCLVATM